MSGRSHVQDAELQVPPGQLFELPTQHDFPTGEEGGEFFSASPTGWFDAFRGIRDFLEHS